MTYQIKIFRDIPVHFRKNFGKSELSLDRAENRVNAFLKEIGDNIVDIKIKVNSFGLLAEKYETIMVIYKID